MVVKLDEQATYTIIKNHRGKEAPARFILLLMEGSLRTQGPYVADNYLDAITIARDEPLVIYNARSKKAFRLVWRGPKETRMWGNREIEPVRLVPHEPTIKKYPLRNSDARLFYLEGH
jgi:hypothetical protein